MITIDAVDDVVSGCTDDTACNYNDQATQDDGSCTFAQTNYDCDGNCTANVDCDGVCGGDAVVDDCSVCGGDGTSCQESTIQVLYDSDSGIGGWQFNLNGATFVSVQGGASADAGYMMQGSAAAGIVLGFVNLGTGVTIPAGSGTLCEVTIQGLSLIHI